MLALLDGASRGGLPPWRRLVQALTSPALPCSLPDPQEGAVFKWVQGGAPADTPWRIFGQENGKMQAVGRMQARASAAALLHDHACACACARRCCVLHCSGQPARSTETGAARARQPPLLS